jgi:hypothetical protein
MIRRVLLSLATISIATLGATIARAEILVGVAGPMTGKNAWFGEQITQTPIWHVWRGGTYLPLE